ncbi:hypothetical protein FRC10_005408 [Ceratobasidium sp. 414]|nr:hypothetical protein FRC10_005408 [Ceratobasidium sp. 414]
MSSELPPPYYTTAAALQAEHRDVASLIRKLSQDIVGTDEAFHRVSVLLAGKPDVVVAPSSLKQEWQAVRKLFQDLIWSARRTATTVSARNGDFIQVIIPLIGEANEPKESKLAELNTFITRPPPKFLTSTEVADQLQQIATKMANILKKYGEHADKVVAQAYADIAKFEEERDKQKREQEAAQTKRGGFSLFGSREVAPPPEPIDYDSKIAEATYLIEEVNKQRDEITAKAATIKHDLNTIPDQVGSCFSAVWTHLTNDATHLRNRLQGSTTDPMPDLSAITRTYTEINSALRYYATNVNKMG